MIAVSGGGGGGDVGDVVVVVVCHSCNNSSHNFSFSSYTPTAAATPTFIVHVAAALPYTFNAFSISSSIDGGVRRAVFLFYCDTLAVFAFSERLPLSCKI